MINVFYGDNREAAESAAKKLLGDNYETVDAAELTAANLPSILLGTTLFANERKILIKDLLANSDTLNALANFLDTPHQIVLLEVNLDRRKSAIKELEKDKRLKFQKFEKPVSKEDRFFSFNIYDRALVNPEAAVKSLHEHENDNEPFAMLGAWNKKALDALKDNPRSARNHKVVRELAEIDVLLKNSKFSTNPWPVLESFLLRLKNL